MITLFFTYIESRTRIGIYYDLNDRKPTYIEGLFRDNFWSKISILVQFNFKESTCLLL